MNRHAGERAQVELQITGELPPDPPAWVRAAPADAAPHTILVVDEAQLVVTSGAGEQIAGLWSSHPLMVMLARRALQTFA